MDGSLSAVYLVGVAVALWAAGLELGVRETPRNLIVPLRRPGLLARVALVDVVLLPLLVWSLVRLVDVPSGYATGLLLVGIASAGPLGVRATQIAGADAATALSLVVVLELANLAAVPVWASLLLPDGASLAPGSMLAALLLLVLMPLATGIAWRRFAPGRADRLEAALSPVANIAITVAVAAVIARDADVVWDGLSERAPVVALIAVLAALVLGWAAGGPGSDTRVAAALVTSVRSNALALAIASSSFPRAPEVRAGVVVFALFSVTLPLVAAVAFGRRALETTAPASA